MSTKPMTVGEITAAAGAGRARVPDHGGRAGRHRPDAGGRHQRQGRRTGVRGDGGGPWRGVPGDRGRHPAVPDAGSRRGARCGDRRARGERPRLPAARDLRQPAGRDQLQPGLPRQSGGHGHRDHGRSAVQERDRAGRLLHRPARRRHDRGAGPVHACITSPETRRWTAPQRRWPRRTASRSSWARRSCGVGPTGRRRRWGSRRSSRRRADRGSWTSRRRRPTSAGC